MCHETAATPHYTLDTFTQPGMLPIYCLMFPFLLLIQSHCSLIHLVVITGACNSDTLAPTLLQRLPTEAF